MRFNLAKLLHQKRAVSWSFKTARIMKLFPKQGIFLTGIEGSDPMVGNKRRDEFLEAGNFYKNYKTRLEKIRSLGIVWLRVGPSYHRTHLGPGQYDFSWFDLVVEECQRLGITIILDLLHFGLPDWMHKASQDSYFQNKKFPDYFYQYTKAIARRYPDIKFFTPINEPFVTARFSAKLGIWNERLTTPASFSRAVVNIARAAILSKQAIREVWAEDKRAGQPIFIQNESFEKAVASPGSGREKDATGFNIEKFMASDLIFGNHDEQTKKYLLENGISKKEYDWLIKNGDKKWTALGIDYYPSCIHLLYEKSELSFDASMPYELYSLTKEYYQRYKLPLLHTEVNGWPKDAVELCQKTYDALYQLIKDGYPVLGMGWYGDESQMDWQEALLTFDQENPVGLFRHGQPQPVASQFVSLAHRGLPTFER